MFKKYLEDFEIKDKKNIGVEKINAMTLYVNHVLKWNRIHNIISRKSDKNSLLNNVSDCLKVLEKFDLPRVVFDAGSGGGLPSIPLAIMRPEIQFKLVECSRKKCSFLRWVKSQLDLRNVVVVEKRWEELDGIAFTVTKAAFSPENLPVLLRPIAQNGRLILWATKETREKFTQVLAKNSFKIIGEHTYNQRKYDTKTIFLAEPEAIQLFHVEQNNPKHSFGIKMP